MSVKPLSVPFIFTPRPLFESRPAGLLQAFLFLLLLCNSHSFSQVKFSAGLLGGITATQYDGDGYAGYNKLGFMAGGYSRTELSQRWDLQFEIQYFQKGARRNPNPGKGQYNQYALSLDYAEVPVMLRAKVKEFVFEGGLGLGVLVRRKEIVNEVDVTTLPNFNEFHRLDFDMNAGIGYTFGGNFELLSRWTYSILPVRPHPSGAVYWFNLNFGEYNSCLSFTLRYHFAKKEEGN